MAADDIQEGLGQHGRRLAGSDAERRAALWLAGRLRGGAAAGGSGRRVRIETFWSHPNWALAAAWHVSLALAGSLVSVSAPKVGGAMILVAILSVIVDAHLGYSPGRLLTPYRASQNVVVSPSPGGQPPVTLVVTATMDSPRAGAIRRPFARGLTATLRRLVGPITPGWAGWLAITMGLVLATAVARSSGSTGTAVGGLQLVPTVALVLALALLADQASAGPDPDDTPVDTGVAAAVAVMRTLSVAPPANLRVELLLQGAGDGGALGLRHHLRAHRLTPPTAVVLALDTTRTDDLGWWISDGPLVPLRTLPIVRRQLAAVSAQAPGELAVLHGRGWGPALPALVRRIPAAQLGSGPGEVDALVRLALSLIDEIDAAVAARRGDAA